MATMITNAGMVLTTNTSGNVMWTTEPQPQEWVHPTYGKLTPVTGLSDAWPHEVEVEFE